MTRELYLAIYKSGKSINDIAQQIGCSTKVFVDKIDGIMEFNDLEMRILTSYIPLNNPIHIFFDNDVPQKGTSNYVTAKTNRRVGEKK